MCGIVGYIGDKPAIDVLMDGLRRLEYRGYDSAGVALLNGSGIAVRRQKGKLAELEKVLAGDPIEGTLGVGHTRWATHGPPSNENAHPHHVGKIAVVHNGIIENHRALRDELQGAGRTFSSQTDTEIVAHLVDQALESGKDLVAAVGSALERVDGNYAVAVVSAEDPEQLVAARRGSPLVVGFGENENFVASDIPALLPYTREVAFLDDGEVARIKRSGIEITTLAGEKVERAPKTIHWTPGQAEKGGYRHFMLKEIFEQPRAMTDTLSGRIPESRADVGSLLAAGGPDLDAETLASFERFIAVGCGTSWHASLLGRHVVERLTRIPMQVELASEFRYRDPIVQPNTLAIFVSQSGETADTIGALQEAARRGCRTLAICNVVDSTIARAADWVLYTHAGPEIGVASTKAFTTQVAAFYLLALHIASARNIENNDVQAVREGLLHSPAWTERALELSKEHALEVARRYSHASDFLFLGRGLNHAIALEGALKLKEISYIHAEGYPAGEMKHGPIALIDDGLPVVAIAPKDATYEKVCSNVEEVRARGGAVIAVVEEDDQRLDDVAVDLLRVPATPEILSPLVTVIPLQLLAYHVAVLKGTDVDQPRNLAKSVTVE